MKAILKLTAIFAFMFTTVVSMASETKSSLLETPNSKNLVFRLNNISTKTIVQLLDSDSNIIYSEKLSGKSDYAKNFDFKNLKSGVYFLEAESDSKITKYVIRIDNNDVHVVDTKEINKPLFNKKDNALHVTLLNKSLKDVDILVYNSDNELVYKETSTGFNVQKVFNFSNAYETSYTVVVEDSNNTYYNEVVIEN